MSEHAVHAGAPERSGRRSFLTWLTGSVIAVWAASTAALTGLFLKPRVTYGPPTRVPIGRPASFASGVQMVFADAKMVVRRDGNRFAAISTVCTHLGCIVNPSETGFDCPCHGSYYDDRGTVTAGPAPRALDWYRVSLMPNGELVVDKHDVVPADTFLELNV